jgi:hypothetical protein
MDSASIPSARICSKCGFTNPDVNRRCGSCGDFLDADLLALQAQVETIVAKRIEAQLQERYKDQKVVEIETTQLIASRLSEWAKILGYFVAIPTALLAVILGVLGLSNYNQFKARIDAVQQDATNKLEQARQQAGDLNRTGESLKAEYEKAKGDLQSINQLSTEVRGLASRVDKIEHVQFSGSTPGAQSHLEDVLHRFQEYFHNLGLGNLGSRPLHVIIKPGREMKGMIAYTLPDEGKMFVGEDWQNDPDLLLREYGHVALYSFHPNLNKDSRYNQNWGIFALESGLATYYPCSFGGKSLFGQLSAGHDGFAPWNLQNQRNFTEFNPTMQNFNQEGGETWGGAFWALRQALGPSTADRLLLTAWKSLRPQDFEGSIPTAFAITLLQVDKAEGGAGAPEIRRIFTAKGLRLPDNF